MMNRRVIGHWVKVQSSNYDEPHEIGLEMGIDVDLFLSPYQIPQKVRGSYDPSSGRLLIEFRYMVDEAYHVERIADHVWARLGDHSGRVVGFEVDVDQLRASSVTLSVPEPANDAYDALVRTWQSWTAQSVAGANVENYHVTAKVLADKHDEVLEGLIPR